MKEHTRMLRIFIHHEGTKLIKLRIFGVKPEGQDRLFIG